MPRYNFRCSSCGAEFEKNLNLKEFKTPQPCNCGVLASRVIGSLSFVLKGDGWIGKNQKLKAQMETKNRRLNSKSIERSHDASMRLTPNVGGEVVDSWDEAKQLAFSKGLSTEAYEEKINQEKTKK